jgi:hypothetical protein
MMAYLNGVNKREVDNNTEGKLIRKRVKLRRCWIRSI